MRNRLKVRGKLRSYLQLPLLLGILLAVMNVLIFMINTEAGIALCLFTVIYLGVVIFTMLLSGPAISSELISFATEYGQVQKQLLSDLEIPYALLDESGKVIWTNDAFEQIMNITRKYSKNISNLIPEITKEKLPKIRCTQQDATYLMWLDMSAYTDDSERLAEDIRKRTGLYLSAGSIYRGNGSAFLRMNVACPRSLVEDGIGRLQEALDEVLGE